MWLQDFFNELDRHLSRDWLRQQMNYEFFGALLPFVLRFGIGKLTDLLWDKVWAAISMFCGGDIRQALLHGHLIREDSVPCRFCGRRRDEAEIELTAPGGATSSANEAGVGLASAEAGGQSEEPTAKDLYSNWDEARRRLGFTKKRLALVVSAARVLLWHWLQPALYFVIFYAYSDLLNTAELYFGLAVAVRELLYFIAVLVGIFHRPGIFLYAPIENIDLHNFLYIVMPEKFIIVQLPEIDSVACVFCGIIVLDVASIVSIILLIANRQWYLPLMVGYAVTAISAVALPLLPCLRCCFDL